MPYRRRDADYLRAKAAHFRQLSAAYSTPISQKMIEVADALEARAAELEQRPDPRE